MLVNISELNLVVVSILISCYDRSSTMTDVIDCVRRPFQYMVYFILTKYTIK